MFAIENVICCLLFSSNKEIKIKTYRLLREISCETDIYRLTVQMLGLKELVRK